MFEFVTQHQFWTAVVIYWIFSAAVSSMPEPASNGSPGYLWLFRFLHSIAGNITTAFGSKIPGLKTFVLVLTIPLMLATPACAARYTIHPGALSIRHVADRPSDDRSSSGGIRSEPASRWNEAGAGGADRVLQHHPHFLVGVPRRRFEQRPLGHLLQSTYEESEGPQQRDPHI